MRAAHTELALSPFPDPWRPVFERWLREHPALDRIEYINVGRRRMNKKDYIGPIVVLTRAELERAA